MEDKAASDTVDLVSESRMPETSMDQCCVCPFCPRACDVVFKTRKMLLDHVRHGGSSHGQVSVPQDADLEWVQAEKVIHCGRYRWVRTVSSSSHQIAVTSFAMDDFRYQSKFEERLHLLTKYAQFVEGGPEFERQHPGFEKRKLAKISSSTRMPYCLCRELQLQQIRPGTDCASLQNVMRKVN